VFPAQPEVEIILVPVEEGPLFDKTTATQLTKLIKQGTFGAGVFYTKNIFATYVELTEKGVNFLQSPKEIEFGTEALFEDNSGNWFSLMQVKK
jgi:predicted enzyme related to lactoylglutathione lyase